MDKVGFEVVGDKMKYKRMKSETGSAGGDEEEDDSCELMSNQNGGGGGTSSSRRYVMACAFFASLNTVLLGYDVGVMSGAILFIKKDLHITEVQEEILVGCLSIVSLIGSLFGGRASDTIGRKWTMAIGAIIFQLGGLLMTISPTFTILMVGRLLSGIGIGFGATILGVYIAEISPASSRGFLTCFPDILINLGILLGYIANYALSGLPSHINWRIMLGLGLLPSVVIAGSLFVIPESPRWLVMQGRVEEARRVLVKTIGDEKEVDDRLDEIRGSAAGIMKSDDDVDRAVWIELMKPSPEVARMLVVGIGIQCFQQITGIDSMVYYSPTIFKAAGMVDENSVLAATVAVGVTKTFFILSALYFIDKLGRKPLLYVSTIGMTVCLFSVAVVLPLVGDGPLGVVIAVLSVCGDVAFFSVAMGPVTWTLNSEIFPLRLRAQAVALGVVANRLCSGLVSLSFLSMVKAITVSGTFFIFFVFSAASVVFVHVIVPETKGKSLEEIEVMFRDSGGKRKQQQPPWSEAELELELEATEHLVAVGVNK